MNKTGNWSSFLSSALRTPQDRGGMWVKDEFPLQEPQRQRLPQPISQESSGWHQQPLFPPRVEGTNLLPFTGTAPKYLPMPSQIRKLGTIIIFHPYSVTSEPMSHYYFSAVLRHLEAPGRSHLCQGLCNRKLWHRSGPREQIVWNLDVLREKKKKKKTCKDVRPQGKSGFFFLKVIEPEKKQSQGQNRGVSIPETALDIYLIKHLLF